MYEATLGGGVSGEMAVTSGDGSELGRCGRIEAMSEGRKSGAGVESTGERSVTNAFNELFEWTRW